MTPFASLKLDRDAIALSDPLTVTLSIEALAPMTVMPPVPLLAEGSRTVWLIVPNGKPQLTKLIDGMERWTQIYRLEPFVPGDAVPLMFAPFSVATGLQKPEPVEIPKQTVKVTTAVDGSKLELRPMTGPEVPPPIPKDEPTFLVPALIVAGAAAILTLAVFLRRKPVLETVDLQGELEQRFARLNATMDSRLFADDLSDILRRSFALQEDRAVLPQTTAELSANPGMERLSSVLARCDAVKFAGAVMTAAEHQELLEDARVVFESCFSPRTA